MKKFRFSALILAAVLAFTPAVSCKDKKNNNASESSKIGYADISDVGKNKYDVSINENAEINSTAFKLNRVIDSGRVKDNRKYIYLDVTIKNNSTEKYDVTGINNFYLILSDGTEVLTDVRADIYAKQSMEGYEHIDSIAAGEEFTGYIGFTVDENVTDFTVCFFPTGSDDDKSSVISCEVKSGDIVQAPEGMFKNS